MTRLAILLRSALLILTLVCVSQTMARSQKYKVTIKAKEQRLLDVFKTIQQQTKLIVFYSNTILNDQEKVSIQVKDEPLEKVLDQIVFGKALKYEVQEKYIVISPKEVKSLPLTEGVNPQLENLPPPDITVKGRITNENGEPIPGASIQIKGTKRGTSADGNGSFTLTNVPDNATLVVSGTNIETVEVRVQGRTELSISTKMKVSELEEVVVNKGFYTEEQKYSVSSVVQVRAKDIEKSPVNNVMLALQGRVTGLDIKQNSGIAGGGVTLRIHGLNSINAALDNNRARDLDPLIVIDGIAYPEAPSGAAFAGISNGSIALNYINPGDIESIDVLKDANATSIYGTRAANGAILITTKKGKAGKAKFQVGFQTGIDRVAQRVDMMNRRQYLDMRYEAFANDGIDWRLPSVSADDLKVWDTTRNTNWQDELLGGVGKRTNIEASVSGGNSNFQYLISGNFNKSSTVFSEKLANTIGNLHFNLSGTSDNRRLKFIFSGSYNVNENNLPGTDLTGAALGLEPIAPTLYNPDGTLNWAPNSSGISTWENPLNRQYSNEYENIAKNMVSHLKLSYNILPGLELQGLFGYTNLQGNVFQPTLLDYYKPENRANSTRQSILLNFSSNSWTIEPQLNFNWKNRLSRFRALAGMSLQERRSTNETVYASGFPSDLLMKSPAAATTIIGNYVNVNYAYVGFFTDFNYIFNDRYILSANLRRDGSSRFGSANLFHNFGSMSGAWLFSQESFSKKLLPIASYGKLRVSYGSTGNDGISDYSYLSLYGLTAAAIGYQGGATAGPSNIANPHIQWEETRKLTVGLDLGFWKDRLLFTANYVFNTSSNQLLSYSLPSTTGFSSITSNFPAIVNNKTLEFSLSSRNIEARNFSWTSDLNFTRTRNKLAEFPGLAQSTYANRLIVGQPTNVIRLYDYLGVNSLTGQYIVADRFGNPTITPNNTLDRVVYFDPSPEFYGGVTNRISYKQFQLDILFQFVKQIGAEYVGEASNFPPGVFVAGITNKPVAILDRWQKSGDNASYARYTSGSISTGANRITSTNGYVDASFVRMKNVALTWNAPVNMIKRLNIQSLKLFTHAQNLLTWTKYKGLDPETQSGSSLPPLQTITFGFQIGL